MNFIKLPFDVNNGVIRSQKKVDHITEKEQLLETFRSRRLNLPKPLEAKHVVASDDEETSLAIVALAFFDFQGVRGSKDPIPQENITTTKCTTAS